MSRHDTLVAAEPPPGRVRVRMCATAVPAFAVSLLFTVATAPAEAQRPGGAHEVAVEVRAGETWLPMVPAHELDRRCPPGVSGPCGMSYGRIDSPLESERGAAELLILRNPWQLGFRVETGWDRLELRSMSHPALDPVHLELEGEPVSDFVPEMSWRPGSRWLACLERGPVGQPADHRSCFRFGTAPLEWGEPFVLEVQTADPPPGDSTVAILIDGDWLALPALAMTRSEGDMWGVVRDDPRPTDHPTLNLTPAPEGEPFRIRLSAGWDGVRISRAPPPESWVDFAGPGHRSRVEHLPLNPLSAHELRIPREGTPGERWELYLNQGTPGTRLRAERFTLHFAPDEG